MGTPCGAPTGIVRAPHGNLQCFSYPTGPVRGPCGTHKGAVRQPYGHVRELTQPELAKLPHGRRIWQYRARTAPLRAPQGLFMGCLQSLNPYVARKLIMHALKLYGPRTGSQNSYCVARGPCDFCSKQPGNSPYGARECDVTEALYWLMTQSHHTPGPPVRAFHGLFLGCFEQKSYVHSQGPHWLRAAPYEFCLSIRGP